VKRWRAAFLLGWLAGGLVRGWVDRGAEETRDHRPLFVPLQATADGHPPCWFVGMEDKNGAAIAISLSRCDHALPVEAECARLNQAVEL
jgi:hypothetical protein